jgi:hypothetical protein
MGAPDFLSTCIYFEHKRISPSNQFQVLSKDTTYNIKKEVLVVHPTAATASMFETS